MTTVIPEGREYMGVQYRIWEQKGLWYGQFGSEGGVAKTRDVIISLCENAIETYFQDDRTDPEDDD